MKVLVEVHAAEGGDDSKLFVPTLMQAYVRMFSRFG
jgi:protein subunit release factor A